jgi:hypothetical protein
MFGGGCSGGLDLTTESSFCQAAAQADCSTSAVQACDLSNGSTIGDDTQRCIDYRSSAEVCNPNNLPYHSAFAGPCVDAHAALYANPNLDPTAYQAMIQACNAVFNRGLQTGASCKSDTDCDVGDGFVCLVNAGGNGTCETPVPTPPGESCANPAAQCVDNSGNTGAFYCEASLHCVSDPTNGQQCGAGIPCAAGERCLAGQNGAMSFCAAQLQDQQPCTSDGDCAGGYCVTGAEGLVCAGQPAPLSFASPACTAFIGK